MNTSSSAPKVRITQQQRVSMLQKENSVEEKGHDLSRRDTSSSQLSKVCGGQLK